MGRRSFGVLLAITAALFAAPAVQAATLSVDDDGVQCPGAPYAHIQNAIDDAASGDTVAICPGTYVEGIGATGTNALTITNKNLTIRGAGADLVAIQPKRTTPTGGQIADSALAIRNGVGDIVSVIGTKAFPVTVNISGVTVDGNGVYVEAGVVYRDGGGTMSRDRVTNIVTSESNTADTLTGGYRSNFPGIGIAQVTSGGGTPALTRPPLVIDHTRVNRYNRIGVLIDNATGDVLPLVRSTVTNNSASLIGDQVVGRTQCSAFNTPTPPPYVLGGPDATPSLSLPGNCATVGLTTIGPTFGQDGVRVTSGSTASIQDSTISANLVHGTGAPTYGAVTNNANLTMGAGIRLIDAGASTVTNSNITDNAYGAYNVIADGATANAATPLLAPSDYWGLRTNATSNVGPAISPTTNPPYQENPVNGAATAVDPTCVTSAGATEPNSTAVNFCGFRNGNQADPNKGELPVAYAPLPMSDAGPSVGLSTDHPTYNRGDTVTLTANATDDFGISKVTFFNGTTQIGTAIPPASTTTYTIPAGAPCATETVSAVAEDSTGQTASASTTFDVVGPNNCQPVPPPVTPATPTVKLTGVPASIGESGATVGADVTKDPTLNVTGVTFKLGTKSICADATAPYTCEILPTGADVGSQSIEATVVDSANQTATDAADTTVAKFQPTTLELTVGGKVVKAKNHKGKPHLYRIIHGGPEFNNRVTQAQGCASGTVTLTVTKNGNTLFPLTQVPLAANCGYVLKFTIPKTKKHNFKVDASFGGNSVLLPISNNRRFK